MGNLEWFSSEIILEIWENEDSFSATQLDLKALAFA